MKLGGRGLSQLLLPHWRELQRSGDLRPCCPSDMASVTPYKREQLPFIHRTWKTALHALDRVSPYGRKPTTVNGDHSINGDEEHHRGVKRRRLDDDSLESSLGINGGFGHLPDNFDEF